MLFLDDKDFNPKFGNEFRRMEAPYINKSQRFILGQRDYSKQFAHIYASRLKEMTELLSEKAKQKWGDKYPIKKLCDLREDSVEECIIIGTLYKHQELKPSVLREISEENQLAPQPPRLNYADDTDKLILEDELQRIRLTGKIDVHSVVTGVVCVVLGFAETDGRFIVEDYLFYESGHQQPLKAVKNSPLLMLISGLDFSATEDITMALELLQQWIYGNLDGFGNCEDWEAASVVRIVIAGNSIRSTTEVKQKSLLTRQPETTNTLDAVKYCDKVCSNWAKSIYVDLMPGEFDPSNFTLPQQPMHQCMFPKSSKTQSFQGVPNPYTFELAGRKIVGTSGQNINDIIRISKIDDPIEVLRSTLVWGHIAPSSPDTLPCYPFVDSDPFIMRDCPHIYFTGNQLQYKTAIHKGSEGQITRLISVPSFSRTQNVVLVNLRTLDTQCLSFKIDKLEE